MANSVLETMQAIEAEAKDVLLSYDSQIQDLHSQMTQDLDQIRWDCEQETKDQVASLGKELTQKKELLQEELTKTMARNDQQVRSVLSDQKSHLVQQIVSKVVARYGD